MRGRHGRKGACGPLIRRFAPPSPRWGEAGAGGNFFGFPIPLRGDHGLLWSGHGAFWGRWLVCPSSPQRGEVPSGCEAMRGRHGRKGACGPLIRRFAPPSPRWGEAGAGGNLSQFPIPLRGSRFVVVWPCGIFGGMAGVSLFSPAGRSAERMRGDEGAAGQKRCLRPPHPALCATFSPVGRRGSGRSLRGGGHSLSAVLASTPQREMGAVVLVITPPRRGAPTLPLEGRVFVGRCHWPGRPVLPLVFFWRLRSPASS